MEKTESWARFSLLRHTVSQQFQEQTGRSSHWDLMLEQDGRLFSWAFDEHPTEFLGKTLLSWADSSPLVGIPTPPHRIEYLDYEGPISGNRGEVRQELTGRFRWVAKEANRFVIQWTDGHVVKTLEWQIQTPEALDSESRDSQACSR